MDLCKGVEKDFRKDNDNEVMKSEGEYILCDIVLCNECVKNLNEFR